jgi:hypothetical protein
VASVQSEDKRIDILARDLQAIRLNPPGATFHVTSAGLKKINEFVSTGRSQQLTSEEISQVKSSFDFLLPEPDTAAWSMVMLPAPAVTTRRFPIRLSFSKDDELIQYEYVEFRVVRAGTDEAEIESTSPLPFVLSVVLPNSTTMRASCNWSLRLEGVPVRDAAKAIHALSLLQRGGSVEFYALDAGRVFGTLFFRPTKGAGLKNTEEIVLDAAAVCEKYGVELLMPRSIRREDIKAIKTLLAIADGTPMAARTFEAQLVKSAEHARNVTSALVPQPMELLTSSDNLQPKPVLFGVPIDTGPVTTHITGATIKRLGEFLRRYTLAEYGEAVAISFRVREIRMYRKGVSSKHLFSRTGTEPIGDSGDSNSS